MKRLMTLLIALAFAISLAACGGSAPAAKADSVPTEEVAATVEGGDDEESEEDEEESDEKSEGDEAAKPKKGLKKFKGDRLESDMIDGDE